MWLIPILLIGVTSNLDNLGVGVSLGVRSGPVQRMANGVIAVISMVGTAMAMLLGRAFGRQLPLSDGRVAGAVIVLAIGTWSIASTITTRSTGAMETTGAAGRDVRIERGGLRQQNVTVREALALGLALSVNNIGVGIGAGMAGLPPAITTAMAGVLSLLAIGPGSRLAHGLGARWLGRSSSLMGGILLIAVGIALACGL